MADKSSFKRFSATLIRLPEDRLLWRLFLQKLSAGCVFYILVLYKVEYWKMANDNMFGS